MKLENAHILIISPEPWSHVFVSKHHYAIELKRRKNEVAFLNPPGKHWNLTQSREGITIIDYPGFPTGMRFFPAIIRQLIVRRTLNRIESMSNMKFEIIWSFDNSVFFDFEAIRSDVLKISHIVDLNMDFQLAKAAASADICFCTTTLILDRMSQYNSNVFKINHGYSSKPVDPSISIPGSNQTKAVYVGNLAMAYLDWDIICRVAEKHDQIDFIFFGPDDLNELQSQNVTLDSKERIKSFPNCYFPGRVDAQLIPSILTKADLLMVTYQEAHHKDQANPHKLMEYLGSGKPIVATFTAEYNDLGLINMSNANKDWPLLFDEVVHNLDKENIENVNARIRFAAQNTYQMQVDRIEEKIRLV